MTVFGCADAHGVTVYNGIGLDDDGMTPSDWLLELEEKRKLFNCRLPDVLDGTSADLETRLRKLRAKYGPKKARHTFVFAVWREGASMIYGVSNYERVDEDKQSVEGSEKVTLSTLPPEPKDDARVVTTGAPSRFADRRAIKEALKAGTLNRVRALSVKAVRDAAYGKGKGIGTVGASAQWAQLGANRDEVWFGLDVVGGAVAQETPNLINIAAEVPLGGSWRARIGGPGTLVKDTYAGGEKVAHYNPMKKAAVFPEPLCGICGSPWPASHRSCEVCLYEGQHKGKRHRQVP
jgi:hypothetical protein